MSSDTIHKRVSMGLSLSTLLCISGLANANVIGFSNGTLNSDYTYQGGASIDKSGLATTRSQLAALLCKSLPTITAWARRYESLGLDGFLGMDYKGGEHLRIIPRAVIGELNARLGTPKGFGSFAEIQSWLKDEHGVEVAYSTVHGLVRYGLNASPKVVRPFSEHQDPDAVEAFKKNCPNRWPRSSSLAWQGTPASATGSRTKATSA